MTTTQGKAPPSDAAVIERSLRPGNDALLLVTWGDLSYEEPVRRRAAGVDA